ncbi:hypothetical protein NQZ68_029708 [Dissostichus eleginoides]|uniref:Protein argonaute 1 n=1 Tax=Dissostichus eleginoides TaxID=100907 RepID=A0AAD9FL86_DISEL|nr:hypothetical protein NQZ68_029708 [Dissostichus eleginoides]KAK1905989.1 Protein argonaute 1 [Dissostichus eleginoides]
MSDLKSFKAEVTRIVGSLARALLSEICSARERDSGSKHNEEEELSALLDALCEDAVDNILKTLHLRDQSLREITAGERVHERPEGGSEGDYSR